MKGNYKVTVVLTYKGCLEIIETARRVFNIITLCVSRRRRKMYCGHARLSVCMSLCVCVSVRRRTPTTIRTRV